MKGKWSSLAGAVIFTALLAFSCLLLWVGLNLADDEEDYLDPEYPVLTAVDEIVTRQYPLEACHSVDFFCANHYARTIFAVAIPTVKVVNSDAYYVELTANQTVHDSIAMEVVDGVLRIGMQDACYKPIYEDDPSYDYREGLCLDSTAFEMTIYAPISTFRTRAKLSLDMEAASAEQVILRFSYDMVNASVHGIDAQRLYLEAYGDSKLTLSGRVVENADIKLWHNADVDAAELTMGSLNARLENRLFAFSSIRHQQGWCINPFGFGTVVSLVLAAFPVLWLVLDVRCLYRLFKHRSA